MRALVIDDSRPIRGIIAKIMRSLNFETVEAANGVEAWEILSDQGPFDIVTVNWEMPEMDGVQFVSKVRRSTRFHRSPMLMISSISDPAQMEFARAKGADEYLIKPCTLGSITKKLQALGVLSSDEKEGGNVLLEEQRQKDWSQDARSNIGSSGKRVGSQTRTPSFKSTKGVSSPSPMHSGRELRVLVVDDSSIVRNVITNTLEIVGGFSVVGNASDGLEGLQLMESLKPDVVLLDIEMPRMDGLEMLRQMRNSDEKVPVVMFSSKTERGAKATTDALLLGAKDFVFKPGGPRMTDVQAGEAVIREQVAPRIRWLCDRVRPKSNISSPPKKQIYGSAEIKNVEMVVIAASTGGPAALASLVQDEHLRKNLNQPILVVQHMPALFTKYLASRLAEESGLDIAEAVEGEVLSAGMIRIAPGGNHLVVNRVRNQYITTINRSEAVNSCRPSADVLFQSAADCVRRSVLGVILTGMGHDGREGCRAIRNAGGCVVAQDESTSVVWGMPGSVVGAGLANHITPMELIGKKISSYLKVGA